MDIFINIEWSAVWLSIKVAILTSVATLPLAIACGYILARKQFKGKITLEALLHLPMVMPPVTTGYILLTLLGTQGLIGQWLYNYFGIRIAFTLSAAVIASMAVSFPLIVRAVKVAMSLVDPHLEEASRTLGASRFKTFTSITLPLAKPGILSGFVLAFARSLGEFGATITFAGNIAGQTRTLPLAIYSKMQLPGEEKATYILVGISVLISFTAIILSEYAYKKHIKNT